MQLVGKSGALLLRGVPQTLIVQMPELRDYTYLKMKEQVLIVDAMTGKVVDMFSQPQPPT